MLSICLLYLSATGYSLTIGTLVSDKGLAVTLTPVLIIPFMLFAGFFVNQNKIPIWLIEFQYVSVFKYGYQALLLNEFKYFDDDKNYNKCREYTGIDYCPNPLDSFESPENFNQSILALVILWAVFHTVALVILKLLSKTYE